MASILHHIKAWLHRNLLTDTPNDYVARVSSDRTLNIDNICQNAVSRGSADIPAQSMRHAVELFHNEVAYSLCDGFSVNTGLYTATTNIKGVFDNPKAQFDPARHRVVFEFHQGALLRSEAANVAIEILGVAENVREITRVTDVRTGSVDDLLTPGRTLRIEGNKIKVAGDDDAVGVYFTSEADGARTKVEPEDVVSNKPSELLVMIPELAAGGYKVEVVTQYGGTAMLKEAQTIAFDKVLTVQ